MSKIKTENLTNCPLCKQDLQAYSIMGLCSTEKSYCPKCNIVRFRLMSMPYLCSECSSESFYEANGKEICWFCGNDKFIGMKYEEAKEKGLFEKDGFKLSTSFTQNKNKCRHKNTSNKRHNETIFKFMCEDCGDVEYISIPIWLQEENNIEDTIKLRQKSGEIIGKKNDS